MSIIHTGLWFSSKSNNNGPQIFFKNSVEFDPFLQLVSQSLWLNVLSQENDLFLGDLSLEILVPIFLQLLKNVEQKMVILASPSKICCGNLSGFWRFIMRHGSYYLPSLLKIFHIFASISASASIWIAAFRATSSKQLINISCFTVHLSVHTEYGSIVGPELLGV